MTNSVSNNYQISADDKAVHVYGHVYANIYANIYVYVHTRASMSAATGLTSALCRLA